MDVHERLQMALIDKIRDVPAADIATVRAYIDEILLLSEGLTQESSSAAERRSPKPEVEGSSPSSPANEDGLSPGSGQSGATRAEPELKNSGQAVEEDGLGLGTEPDAQAYGLGGNEPTEPFPLEPDDYKMFGTPPDVPPPTRGPSKAESRSKRKRTPCSECGQPISPQGMPGHVASHQRNNSKPRAADAPSSVGPPAPSPSPLPGQNPDQLCRFCGVECGSVDSRAKHESLYCDKRLQERASVPHVHRWKIDPPKEGFAKGICNGCGITKQFDQEPNVAKSWGNQQLTGQQSRP